MVKCENLVGERKEKKKVVNPKTRFRSSHTLFINSKVTETIRTPPLKSAFNWRASPRMHNHHPPVETYNAYVDPYLNNTYNFNRIKSWFNQPYNSNKKKPGKKNVLVQL
jgi:hypothetical protein